MLKLFLHKIALGVVGLATFVATIFGGNQANFGATVPTVVSVFQTSLASAIATTDTAMTMVLGTDRAGTTLSGYYCFTVDAGTAIQEFMCGTVAGTAVSSMTRGIDPQNPNTSVTALKFAHRRGAEVKITDYPQLAILSRIINGTDTFPNQLTYASHPAVSGNQDIPDKQYVDGVAVAGASNANTTTKGIVQQATVSQLNAGTATGSTGAILIGSPSDFASSIYGLQLPTSGQKSALVGNNTDIAVGSSNTFITQTGLQHGAENYAVDSSVSANTITVTLSPVPTSYTAGMVIKAKVANATTAATTINVNSLGAKTVKKYVGAAVADLAANDILANQTVTLAYDGTNFILQSPSANTPAAAGVFKTGSTTHDMSSTTTTTIAHGLGSTPRFVRLTVNHEQTSSATLNLSMPISIGTYDGSTQVANYTAISTNGSTAVSSRDTTHAIHYGFGGTAGADSDILKGTISLDATNITITWAATGSPTGTGNILWEAFY